MRDQPQATALPPPSTGLRRYLYFTAGVTGAIILVIEILGAKVLAPYFGTSHFVWTAQIAITLLALAAGYYVGGRLADRSTELGRVYGMILGAAIWLELTGLSVKPVAYWCLDFNLPVGSLLAAAFLFFPALALLAMTGPFFVRSMTSSLATVGGNVGRLTAISTLGSLTGTVLIGYVLIPHFRNSTIMFFSSALLSLLSGGYFLVWGRKRKAPAAGGCLLALVLAGLGPSVDKPASGAHWSEIYRANSNFGQLQVIAAAGDTHRFFLDDFLTQNTYDPIKRQGTSAFTYLLHDLARGYAPDIADVLCIGLGVGLVPTQFSREGARVDVVEINPAVLPVAERFFDLDRTRFNLIFDDGRHFINRCTNSYSVICLDAFVGDAPPSHLMSREAFVAMQRRLKPGGVLVINSLGGFEAGKEFVTAALEKTLRAVFAGVRVHASGEGNVFFVASDNTTMALRHPPDLQTVHEACREEVRVKLAHTVHTDPEKGIVLSDDFNPADYYDAAHRETVRRQLALRMNQ